MIRFQTTDENIRKAIQEVLKELPKAEGLQVTFELAHTNKGLWIKKDGKEGIIHFADRRSLMRAVGLAVEHGKEERYELKETPDYEVLGAMPDTARNAVPKVETLKKLCRILALEGYNSLLLYMEDNYEIPGQPYFGHLRGRYTAEELKELDAYAELLGIELMPAIQTLAHLSTLFEWPAYYSLQDCNDILLVGDEKVYELIDQMLAVMSQNIKSRRINIGLDEADMIGGGQYLTRYGYKERSKIMAEHLLRVTELCKKYGYEPRIWSDMFFRMVNHGAYRVKGATIPESITAMVPPELTLVYWDYSQLDRESYDEMFRQHRSFQNPTAFAGGDASWYGIVPLTRLAQNCALAAAESLKKNQIGEVYVTMWRSDGGPCSWFASLNSLFIYGEACWGGVDACEQKAAERMKSCTGLEMEDVLSIEDLHKLPGNTTFGWKRGNPSKYMFYENVLQGRFDVHVPKGSNAQFAKMNVRLKEIAGRAGDYGYLFETLAGFAEVLSRKAELGWQLYEAYHADDREALTEICNQVIPAIQEGIRGFRRTLRNQWFRENKSFGFDALDVRIGGVLEHMDTAQYILSAYLEGSVSSIEELEAERLPYLPEGVSDKTANVIEVNRWERIAAVNLSNMIGYK